MNVHVLGSDYPTVGEKIALSQQALGVDIDWGGIFNQIAPAIVKDTSAVTAQYVSKRLSPTQKSVIGTITGTTSSVPANTLPKRTFMQENGTYIMIGGAVLLGAIILMSTRRGRSAVVA